MVRPPGIKIFKTIYNHLKHLKVLKRWLAGQPASPQAFKYSNSSHGGSSGVWCPWLLPGLYPSIPHNSSNDTSNVGEIYC